MKKARDHVIKQNQFTRLVEGMHPGNENYDALLRRLDERGKKDKNVTRTTYWHWIIQREYKPEEYFFNTPPVCQAPESDRVLITGTNSELENIWSLLYMNEFAPAIYQSIRKKYQQLSESSPESKRISSEGLISNFDGLIKVLKEVSPEKRIFSSCLDGFWLNFFGEERFLDNEDKISLPRLIIGTGKMRNYNEHGCQTVSVKERLKIIAATWGIPTKFIESWAI